MSTDNDYWWARWDRCFPQGQGKLSNDEVLAICTWAEKFGTPAAWLYGVARVESSVGTEACDASAVGRAGEHGLMQFMPQTWEHVCTHNLPKHGHPGAKNWTFAREAFNPLCSAEAASCYIADLKRNYPSWEDAIAAYHLGERGFSELKNPLELERYLTVVRTAHDQAINSK